VLSQFFITNQDLDNSLIQFGAINDGVVEAFISIIDETSITWEGISYQDVAKNTIIEDQDDKFVDSTKKDYPFVVVIPEKPHPSAVLLHGDVVKLDQSSKPFALRFILIHPDNRYNFPQAMEKLLSMSSRTGNTHIWVADSAYTTSESFDKFQQMDKKIILSIRKNFLGDTGELLDRFCTKPGSIAFKKKKKISF
jgi:hypothetical protein